MIHDSECFIQGRSRQFTTGKGYVVMAALVDQGCLKGNSIPARSFAMHKTRQATACDRDVMTLNSVVRNLSFHAGRCTKSFRLAH